VIVSDYAMSAINGVELLTQARKIAQDTMRVMLTGFANMDNALATIHEGNIFRFLTKPCELDALAKDQEVPKPIMERLRSFPRTVGVLEPVRMRVPI